MVLHRGRSTGRRLATFAPVTNVQREVIVQPVRRWYIQAGRKSDRENDGAA